MNPRSDAQVQAAKQNIIKAREKRLKQLEEKKKLEEEENKKKESEKEENIVKEDKMNIEDEVTNQDILDEMHLLKYEMKSLQKQKAFEGKGKEEKKSKKRKREESSEEKEEKESGSDTEVEEKKKKKKSKKKKQVDEKHQEQDNSIFGGISLSDVGDKFKTLILPFLLAIMANIGKSLLFSTANPPQLAPPVRAAVPTPPIPPEVLQRIQQGVTHVNQPF